MTGLCVIIYNLESRNIAGTPSNGMVLFASTSDKTQFELIRPPEGCKPGDRIYL